VHAGFHLSMLGFVNDSGVMSSSPLLLFRSPPALPLTEIHSGYSFPWSLDNVLKRWKWGR
jgi:hypothetical protein